MKIYDDTINAICHKRLRRILPFSSSPQQKKERKIWSNSSCREAVYKQLWKLEVKLLFLLLIYVYRQGKEEERSFHYAFTAIGLFFSLFFIQLASHLVLSFASRHKQQQQKKKDSTWTLKCGNSHNSFMFITWIESQNFFFPSHLVVAAYVSCSFFLAAAAATALPKCFMSFERIIKNLHSKMVCDMWCYDDNSNMVANELTWVKTEQRRCYVGNFL